MCKVFQIWMPLEKREAFSQGLHPLNFIRLCVENAVYKISLQKHMQDMSNEKMILNVSLLALHGKF